MTKIISVSKLPKSLLATTGLAFALVATMMFGFQYVNAAEVNITTGSNLTIGSTGQEVVILQSLTS